MNNYSYNLEILDQKVALLYFSKSNYKNVIFSILKDVILNEKIIFYSLTINEDEISLFIEQNILKTIDFEVSAMIDKDYKVIRVFDAIDGIGNVGIVSQLSSIMAEKGIPILYVNSFNNNYIIIKECNLEKSLECFKENGFLI